MIRRLMPVAAVLMFAAFARAAAEPEPRTICVAGTASVFVAPDRVDVRFTVTAFDKDLAKAKAANDASAAKVIDFLKLHAVDAKDVQAEFATSDPVYGREQTDGRWQRGPLSGFNVTRSYAVRLDDVATLPVVLDRLLTDPTVTVAGHAFSSRSDRQYRDQARHDACVAATEKAKALAASLDATVGPVRTVNEVPTDSYRATFRVANSANHAVSGGGGGDDAGELAPVGQIEVRGEVNVTFDLVPNPANDLTPPAGGR